MSRRRCIESLTSELQAFIDETSVRHSHRKSIRGALLAEIAWGDSLANRGKAAFFFGLLKYRVGLRVIEKGVLEVLGNFGPDDPPWGEGSPERSFLSYLLFALGSMDTPGSHALLAKLIRESPSCVVRADALEACAFEEEQFDWDLVFPFVTEEAAQCEILSALYALEFHSYAIVRPEEARERVAPLLTHSYSMIREFALRVLLFGPDNLDLILPLRDQHPGTVEEAIRMHEGF